MERVTNTAWGNLDPWECCGQDYFCKRGCHDEGGCANGCIVPKLYVRLAKYEDTGLSPEEIEAQKPATHVAELFMSQVNDAEQSIRIAEARRDKRLLILPVAIGTHLWKITFPYRQEPKVTEFVVKNFRTSGKKHRIQLEVQAVGVPGTNWMEFKRFFTSREEAEAAFNEMKGEN